MIRKTLNTLMVLALVATAQGMAVARGTPGPAGELVLCTGQGAISVQVDENGQPVGAPHICPDCALSLFDAAVLTPVVPVRPLTRSARVAEGDPVAGKTRNPPRARARGPPRQG